MPQSLISELSETWTESGTIIYFVSKLLASHFRATVKASTSNLIVEVAVSDSSSKVKSGYITTCVVQWLQMWVIKKRSRSSRHETWVNGAPWDLLGICCSMKCIGYMVLTQYFEINQHTMYDVVEITPPTSTSQNISWYPFLDYVDLGDKSMKNNLHIERDSTTSEPGQATSHSAIISLHKYGPNTIFQTHFNALYMVMLYFYALICWVYRR